MLLEIPEMSSSSANLLSNKFVYYEIFLLPQNKQANKQKTCASVLCCELCNSENKGDHI